MELRTLRIGPSPSTANRALTPDEGQGFLSWCLQTLGKAREELNLPLDQSDELDNFLNTHLASVLTYGLNPAEEVVKRYQAGPLAVYGFVDSEHRRRQRHWHALEHGQMALLIDGLRLIVHGTTKDYRRIENVGYDCYVFAAETLHSHDFDRQVYQEVAINFQRYATLINLTAQIMRRKSNSNHPAP